MLPNFGMGELALILLIVLVLFGPKRLPEIARGLGRSVKALKDGLHEAMEDHPRPAEKPETKSQP